MKLKPNKTIFAIILYDNHVNDSTSLFINDKILFECKHASLQSITNCEDELSHIINLQRIRPVCLTFTVQSCILVSSPTACNYGEFKTSEAIAWIHKWKGTLRNSRIRICKEDLRRNTKTFTMILTSSRILKDTIC